MRELLLIIHLSGAIVALTLVVGSVVAMFGRYVKAIRPLAIGVAVIGIIQIVSGTLLSVVSGSSVVVFCIRVGAYLAILGLTEFFLLLAQKRLRFARLS